MPHFKSIFERMHFVKWKVPFGPKPSKANVHSNFSSCLCFRHFLRFYILKNQIASSTESSPCLYWYFHKIQLPKVVFPIYTDVNHNYLSFVLSQSPQCHRLCAEHHCAEQHKVRGDPSLFLWLLFPVTRCITRCSFPSGIRWKKYKHDPEPPQLPLTSVVVRSAQEY